MKIKGLKLVQNTIALRRNETTRSEAVAYFIRGIARELRFFPGFFAQLYSQKFQKRKEIETIAYKVKHTGLLLNSYLKNNGKESYFDFNGAKLPDVSKDAEKLYMLGWVYDDVFLFPCFLHDNYDSLLVRYMDGYLREGPYGYVDGAFDVTVKEGDVVIDAGAWIGDFSAYAASKGASAYAFEPIEETFQWLCKTRDLNTGQIHPIKKGLGSSECELNMTMVAGNSAGNRVHTKDDKGVSFEKVEITTLDKFVEENKLTRIDFIKADIEGAERDMLRGATKVLQKFAPKLAICTYHLPDDPEVLEKIILDANPNYKVVHLRHKLMAAVV
ncbi:hypothetical protein AGMMS4957_04250 [Bacteroidia bacterium]|nr:hypothetical protein AGMMS4957_04250 [Bacteroidia bacterium]